MEEFVRKGIYASTQRAYRSGSEEDRLTFKVGESEVYADDVEGRTRLDDNSSDREEIEVWVKFEGLEVPRRYLNGRGEFDTPIREYLVGRGHSYYRKDKSREFITFNPGRGDVVDIDDWDSVVRYVRSEILIGMQRVTRDRSLGRRRLRLTPDQYEILEDFIIAFRAGDLTLIAELCARFGKTLLAIALLLSLEEEVMVVATYWLSSLTSFMNEVLEFIGFEEIEYIDSYEEGYLEKVGEYRRLGKKVIVGVSLHGSKNGKDGEYVKKESLRGLREMKGKFIFVDEADFGAKREKQVELIRFMRGGGRILDKLILASGTGAVSAGALYPKIDSHHVKTYLDLLLSKGELAKGKKVYNPRLGLPFEMTDRMDFVADYEFYKLRYPGINLKGRRNVKVPQSPSWNKAIEDPKKAIGFIKGTFGALFNGYGDYEYLYLGNVFNEDNFETRERDIMIWVPAGSAGKKECLTEFARILDGIIDRWDVHPLHTGNGDLNGRNAERKVKSWHNRAVRDGKNGVIIVSSQLGSRSFSVPYIDTTLLAYDRGSADQTAQKFSRVGTPYKDGRSKLSRIVTLSIDPTRRDVLDVPILEMAGKYADKNGVTITEALRENMRTMNVWTMDEDGRRVGIDIDEYTEQMLDLNAMSDVFAMSSDIDGIMGDPRLMEELLNAELERIGRVKKSPEEVGELGKRFLGNKDKVPRNKEEEVVRSAYLKILNALSALSENLEYVFYYYPESDNIEEILYHVIDTRLVIGGGVRDSLLYYDTFRGDNYVEGSKFDEFIETFGVDPRLVLELIQKRKVPVHLLNARLSVQKKKFGESKIR